MLKIVHSEMLIWQLKTWELPEDLEGVEHLTEPVASIQVGENKVECLRWHPSAANIIAVAAGPTAKIFDVNNSVKVYGMYQMEVIFSILITCLIIAVA